MRRAFFFDQSRCMGCNACTVACKDWNGVNPGPVRWRTQKSHETDNSIFSLSMSCNHCEAPACVVACPSEAITKLEDGVVRVDRTKCVSALACVKACPFGAPKTAGDKQEPERPAGAKTAHPAQKCDFCHERIERDEQPVCVAACPARALDSGDYEFLKKKYPDAVQINRGDFPYAYAQNDETTGPSFLIRKRRNLTII